VLEHDGADAQPAVRGQASQGHDVQTPLVLGGVDATADGAHDNVVVVGQFGQFAGLQDVHVELVVVGDRKHHGVELLKLLDVVGRHIAQFDAVPAGGKGQGDGLARVKRHF